MNRLESKNTTKELKDNFKKERNAIISSSWNYSNQMNNYQHVVDNTNKEPQEYIYNDLLTDQMSAQKKPLPYTDINNINSKIKSLSEIGNYTNFIPLPKDTRNDDMEVKKIDDNDINKNITFNKVYNQPHPKTIYTENNRNELLENQRTIIENKPVDLENIKEFNSSYNSNNSIYIAEIGDKRKLSNIIYDSISRVNNTNKINEYQIYYILNKLNIKDNKWSKENTKQFVEEYKKINEIEAGEDYNNNHIIQEKRLFERNTKEIEYYVTIDSNDRDKEKWKDPNNYQIIFGPTSDSGKNIGYINQIFNNVQSVELIEAIIPRKTKNGTNYDTLPYILLEIPELGSVYQGTNDFLRKTFSQLVFDNVVGNYRYCSFSNKKKINKFFNPRIALNRLTIQFLKPNGEFYNFGDYTEIKDDDGNTEIIPNNILTFKITCIQKTLDSMFLNNKN
tara:strand:- start:1415 stop:2761 length:1347 start_codon:yes stop_codon:yes gene_type:complete